MLEHIEYDRTTRTGIYFRDQGGLVEHLNVEHPMDLSGYLQRLPKLRSAKFTFNKSAYKKAFDQEAQLIHFLENTQLTRLEIFGSSQLTELPEVLRQHPLRSLKISNCPNITSLAEILPHLEELVVLSIRGKSIDLGERFPILPKLKKLSLELKEVSSLRQLSLCYKLEDLFLNGLNVETLPEDISRLQNLKKINFSRLENLKTLPSFAAAENLEILHLIVLPSMIQMEVDFSQMQKLQDFKIVHVGKKQGTFIFPDSLSECKSLKNLTLVSIPIPTLPRELGKLHSLENISLTDLPIEEIPEIFKDMPELNYLQISDCARVEKIPKSIQYLKALKYFQIKGLPNLETLELDFYPLENLESLTIENCLILKKVDPSLAQNTQIKKISLTTLPQLNELPPLGRRNLRLEQLGMRDLPKLTSLPVTFTALPALTQISAFAVGIESLPNGMDTLKTLSRVELYAENLSHLPPEIANINTLNRFTLGTNFTKKDEKILSIQDLYPNLNKLEGNEVKRAILYWIGNGYTVLPLTNELKENTFNALNWSVKNLHLLLLSRIHYFNVDQQKITAKNLTKNKKVWINGTLAGNKTIFKKKLKELGLKVETRFSDKTDLVVMGKKPQIPEGIFTRPLQFVAQLEMEEIFKVESPGLLQKEDVPADFIYNLQQLLWSADPQNEAVALELVKANGLPESVEEDFLLVAKICKDKNLKNRIRTFLKGRVSEAKQKAITTGSAPFSIEKLSRVLPPESLAKMYYAEFRRTKNADPNFFRHDDGTHPGRAEMFQGLRHEFVKNYGFVKNHLPLLEEEYNLVFSQPAFLGNLKRVRINLRNCTKIPAGMLAHIDTLKKLELTIDEKFAVDSIYALSKINALHLNGETGAIPKEIANLMRLHTFFIHSNKPITLPEELGGLKKLRILSVYPSLKNREYFVERLPHLF